VDVARVEYQGMPVSPHGLRKPKADWVVAVPAVVTLAVTLFDLSGSSYWRDETATVAATTLSFPHMVLMLGHVDAVHGLFYSIEWGVARLFGTSEGALRWPSAFAIACGALGIAVIGRRLMSARAGVLAGLVFAALPMVSWTGQNARPNAMVVAAAVLASYLLLVVIEQPGRRQLVAYALAIALMGYLNLVSLLLVPAHAVTVGLFVLLDLRQKGQVWTRQLAGRWVVAAIAGITATTPVLVFGWRERSQIGWIPIPGWSSVQQLLLALTMGSAFSVAVISILATLGALTNSGLPRAAGWPLGGGQPAGSGALPAQRLNRLAWLCLPWIVVPPAIGLFAAQGQVHFFYYGYLLYLLPAVALLSGAGLASLPAPGQVAALTLIAILALPGQLADRRPNGHGDDIRGAALFLEHYARSSDAAIYGGGRAGGQVPDWAYAYPYGFTKPRNIAWQASAAESGTLGGTAVPLSMLEQRLRAYNRVWVVEVGHNMPDTPAVPPAQFRLVDTWRISDIWLRLYGRYRMP
jgi:mannosyltransferase